MRRGGSHATECRAWEPGLLRICATSIAVLYKMPPEAEFPLYRDVDLHMILNETEQEDQGLFYKGLIIECGFKNVASYNSPEAILATPPLNVIKIRIMSF